VRWMARKAAGSTWGRRPGGLDISVVAATGASGLSALPGYANISEIATGTFATVYRATELGTGRPVALKVLRVADTSRQMVEVFDQELEALSLLSNHPNVTTLYRTFITPEGRPVLVLELCKGSLAQRVRQNGPMSAQEVVQVGVKIAGALETAHRAGLLHRDMKPQNILVSEFDEPVLADFGVAALQVAAQSTEGVFGFTTLHAPPEALEGQPLSPAADIYGLASSMYQLLFGRGPFAAFDGEAPASVILRILRDPAPRPPAAEVPIALADLLEGALAKDPARRPQSAGAFAESLREVEALAGWPQTPYVVWGPPTAGGARAGEGASGEVAAGAAEVAGPSAKTAEPTATVSKPAELARPATKAPEPTAKAEGAEATPRAIPPPPAGPRLPGAAEAPPPGRGGRAVLAPLPSGRNVVVPVPAAPPPAPRPPGGGGHEAELASRPGPGPGGSTAGEGERPRVFSGTIPLTGWLGRGATPRLSWGEPYFRRSQEPGSGEAAPPRGTGLGKPLSLTGPLRGGGRRAGTSSQGAWVRWQKWWAVPLTLAAAVGVLIGLGIAALLGRF
jgi:hypothetical protein